MAEVTRYVNTASTAGTQDGTTSAPGNSGTAAYESLSTWESAEQTNAVADGDNHVVICIPDGGADTSLFAISGWTLGASNDIVIRPESGDEHNGVSRERGGSGFQIRTTSADALSVAEDYVTVQDLELTVTTANQSLDIGVVNASNALIFERCIFSKSSIGADTYIILSGDADAVLTLENCLVISYNSRPMDLRTSASVTINHCGVICETSIGVLTDGSATITNSWFFNNNGSAFHSSTSAPASDSNNACNDTSFTDEGFSDTSNESLTMANEITAVGTDFADPSTVDASIKSDGTKTFDDAGTGSLADDITNTAREGTPDIGPYELIGGAAPIAISQLMMMGVGT